MPGFHDDELDALPLPLAYGDRRLVGRGVQTFRNDVMNPLHSVPTIIAVTDQGEDLRRCMYSDDPINWWEMAAMPRYVNGSGSNWSDLIYIPEMKLVFAIAALNNGGNRNVIAASRDGRNWVGRSDDVTTVNNGIAWSPSLNLICIARASGTTTSNRILTSPDGFVWTERALPTINITLNCIAWSPTLSLFVAMGSSNVVFTSPDGVTWTSRTAPISGGSWRRVIWAGAPANKFYAFDGNNFAKSSDGISWGTVVSILPGNGRGLAYSPSLDVIVVSDANNNNRIDHSSNGGTSWTQHTVTGFWQDVVWSARLGLFIAVGGRDLATSPDGATWTNRTSVSPIPNNNGITRMLATA